ncbi:MAG: hypothetical protein HQK49_15845 [Oligoflexia bacterium]|nr:hypothetical protein [Oligoflexia bacterium]
MKIKLTSIKHIFILLTSLVIATVITTAITTATATAATEEFHKHPNGGGLVSSTAKVASSVYLGPNVIVSGNAEINDNVIIKGKNIVIKDNAQISDDVCLEGDNILIKDNAQIWGDATIKSNSTIGGYVSLAGQTTVKNSTLNGIVAITCNALKINNKQMNIPVPNFCQFPYEKIKNIRKKKELVQFTSNTNTNKKILITNPNMDSEVSVVSEEDAKNLISKFVIDNSSELHKDFPYDGCFNRSHIIAMKMEEKYNFKMAKAFIEVPARISTNIAGKIISSKQCNHLLSSKCLVNLNTNSKRKNVSWTYHTAAMILVGNKAMIFDPLISDQPIEETKWVASVTKKLKPNQLVRFYYSHRFTSEPQSSDEHLKDYTTVVGDSYNSMPIPQNVPRSKINEEIKKCFARLIKNKKND